MALTLKITIFVVFYIFCSADLCKGQILGLGPCPKVTVMPNFNVSKYVGLWYEVSSYPAALEDGAKCISANYELEAHDTVKFLTSQYNPAANNIIQLGGTGNIVDNAKLLMTTPSNPGPLLSNYWILETDYLTYSVVFSCTEFPNDSHSELIRILGRERAPSMNAAIKSHMVIDDNGLPLRYLRNINQTECPE